MESFVYTSIRYSSIYWERIWETRYTSCKFLRRIRLIISRGFCLTYFAPSYEEMFIWSKYSICFTTVYLLVEDYTRKKWILTNFSPPVDPDSECLMTSHNVLFGCCIFVQWLFIKCKVFYFLQIKSLFPYFSLVRTKSNVLYYNDLQWIFL